MNRVKDKVVLITGATNGLGKGTAKRFASMGATVLLHGRVQSKLEAVKGEIIEETVNDQILTYRADLASLEEVRGLASAIESRHDKLDVLINNAGVGFGRPGASRELSKDGFELRFAVNYLAPYALTNLLLKVLLRSAPSRIVNVGSLGQEPIDFTDLMLERDYNGKRAYRRSKAALAMFTFDLAERLAADKVTVNCLHPATYMDTNMVREANVRPWSRVEEGVESVIYVAASRDLDGVTGKFFDEKVVGRAIAQAYDPAARMRLREVSERMTGIATPQTLVA